MFRQLLYKEWLSEWRNPYQIGGLISFLSGVSFLVYFFSGRPSLQIWNFMYWLIYLFLSLFAATRVYEDDQSKYRIYNHTLYNPLHLFFAKVAYLTLLLWVLGLFLCLVLNVLAPLQNGWSLWWIPILGCISLGFGTLSSFTSFLASHAASKQMLMIVITLPLCFPLLGLSYAVSREFLSIAPFEQILWKSLPLIAVDLFVLAFAMFLLPLSWKN